MARIIPRKDKRKTTFTVTVRIKGYDSASRTFYTNGGPRAWASEVKAEMKGRRFKDLHAAPINDSRTS